MQTFSLPMRCWLLLRAIVFYTGFYIFTVLFMTSGAIVFSFAPYWIRGRYMVTWNVCVVYWLRLICGVKFRVLGRENIPNQPYIAVANHQSPWETFFLQYDLFPVCIVLKQELLRIPFFGWGLRMVKPIAIDRENPRQAIRQTQEQGAARLREGISVLIFPEGTRKPAGEPGKFARSGAGLAVATQAPLVPIALNAGEYWPAHHFLKAPGTITVSIGPALIPSADEDSRVLNEKAESWIKQELTRL